MLMARAPTTTIATNETADSDAKSTLIRSVNGIASAGAKLVPLAKDV
jgi:hypothetical protein